MSEPLVGLYGYEISSSPCFPCFFRILDIFTGEISEAHGCILQKSGDGIWCSFGGVIFYGDFG